MKKRDFIVFLAIILIVIAIFMHIKSAHVSIHSTTIYQTSNGVEIHMNVLLNTWGGCDEEKISKEVINEHQKINGIKGNEIYQLYLYRTYFHYRRNWKYDTIICDENGAIICCKEDLGV